MSNQRNDDSSQSICRVFSLLRWLVVAVNLVVFISLGLGQERVEILDAAREVMAQSRYCALITIDEQGVAQARTMDPFAPTEEFTIWLGTKRQTGKVEEIQNKPVVTLYYFKNDPPAYLTISGKARLVDDEEIRAKYWKKEWSAFYEDDYRGSDYILIEVVPEVLEIVSYEHGIAADPKAWGPAVLRFSGGEVD